MSAAINALIPVVLVVVIGYLARHRFGVGDSFWSLLERFTYYLFAPSLLVVSLASKSLDEVNWLGLVSVTVAVLLLAAALVSAWQCWRPLPSGVFTSLFQGSVRFNSFVCLALADSLFGAAGLLVGSLVAAVVVISVNILCVMAYSRAAGNAWLSTSLFKQLATNPLLLGCLVGLAINASGLGLTKPLEELLWMLGKTALPMALLAVGAALQLRAVKGSTGVILASSAVQFIVKPLAAFWLGSTVGLAPLELAVVVIFLAVPTAPSAYILARQLGGDHQLMATIITAQTLLAVVTLSITLSLVLPLV